MKLVVYQVRNGMWKKPYTAEVTEEQMDRVRGIFTQNGMATEEEEGVFKVKSPALEVTVKMLSSELQVRFTEGRARPV